MSRPRYMVILAEDGTELHRELLTVRDSAKPFSSGAVGYMASGKAIVRNVAGEDAKHQLTLSLVEVGTKRA